MTINPNIFKSYDIRGVYPSDLNEENIVPIIKAVYSFLKDQTKKDQLTIVLSRDMRLSSPLLFRTALKILKNEGAEIIDIGLSSTPTFYFAVYHYGYDGGIQISASHNPKEYNGLKIVKNSEKGLIKIGKTTGMEDIKKLSIEQSFNSSSQKTGTVKNIDMALSDEIKNALKIVGNPEIADFKVVADTANAMGALYIEELFKNIKGKLIRMNFELDGSFPAHQPDPLQAETLVDLQKKVVEENADLGLAPDGDGDRLFFIDEKGQIVPASIITSLVAKELLKTHKNEKILFDIRYILTPKKIVEECGGTSIITKVGHAFITEKLHETGGIFAGESSAHYFFRESGNGESQVPVILMVLAVMTKEGKKLSQLTDELRRSYESGEVNFKVTNAKEIMQSLKEKYRDGELSELDGVAISYPSWRFSLRTSNTEPLLRLNIEAFEKDEMEQKKNEIVDTIKLMI